MKYYVHVPDDDPPGYYSGGKSLKSAKAFARIGSQYGRDRYVTRGVEGPVIRIYSCGVRVFPTRSSDLEGMTRGEWPREVARWRT